MAYFKEVCTALSYMKPESPIDFLKYVFGIMCIPNTDMASATLLDRFLRSIIHGPLIETARK
jgi:hypothetical protein